jgi:iron transport multicopper oxidase
LQRIHDPEDPFLNDYDEEFVMTVSDWYHDEAKVLIEQLVTPGYAGTSVSFLLFK